MSKINFVCFVTVRTKSTRLPSKCLLPFGTNTVLSHVLERCRVSGLSPIVCTTDERSDNVIAEFCTDNKIDFFRGSVKNKLKRWLDCAKKFSVSYFHTVDADDPFFDYDEVKYSLELIRNNGLDIVEPSEYSKSGAAIMGYSLSTSYLEKVVKKIALNEDTEHIPNFIYLVKGFKKAKMPEPISEIKLRLTLDYLEDYYLLRLLYDELGGGASRNQINELFLNNPVLHKINWFRRFDYLNNQTLMESGTQ